MNIRRLRKEVEYLEAEHRRSEEEPDQKSQRSFEDSWKMQLEWTALHLLRHLEPDFTLDQTDTFWTLDGRFALSRYRMDLRGFLGARTDAVLETLTPERWERFLEADEEAAELLKRLLELGEDDARARDLQGARPQVARLGRDKRSARSARPREHLCERRRERGF